MNKAFFILIVACLLMVPSASWAMDIYDWRAKAEGLCAQSFKIFDRPIQGAMAGGRPEKLVVEKIETMKDSISTIQALGEVDETTARTVIKALVHSYFTDKRLLNPLNFDPASYKQVYKSCSASVLRYDPDGKKAEAYKKVTDEKREKQRKIDEANAAEEEHRQAEEEAARLEEQKKQNEIEAAKIVEENRKRQEAEQTRLEEQRKQRELQEAQEREAARIIKVEEEKQQIKSYTDDGWAYMLQLEKGGYNKTRLHKAVIHLLSVNFKSTADKAFVESVVSSGFCQNCKE